MVNLLLKSSCSLVLTQSSLKHLLATAKGSSATTSTAIRILDLPDLREIYPQFGTEKHTVKFEAEDTPSSTTTWSDNDTALYLHSAGSTGLPKAIRITRRMVVHWINSRMCSSQPFTETSTVY